jgi:hypothetical protein
MNKSLNNLFLKQLIDSDFVFSKSFLKNKQSVIDGAFVLDSNNQLNVLDIFQLNSSLKQLIRILELLKTSASFTIYIWSTNKYLLGLTEKFNKDFGTLNYIKCSTTFPKIDSSENKLQFLFILGEPSLQKSNLLINSKILPNNVFLVNKFNFLTEKHNYGIYKIQNDLSDYKKMILLLIVIFNTIKK